MDETFAVKAYQIYLKLSYFVLGNFGDIQI